MDTVTSCITHARRVVIKIGSSLLVDASIGQLRHQWLQALIDDVAWLKSRGTTPLIVSSGSIALGRKMLGLGIGNLPLEQIQAAAAVGQIRLAYHYEEALQRHNLWAAQILLTLDVSRHRRRYLNSRATFESLLDQGVVPVVNENDSVATDEIRFGDNDRLAAQVAVMTNADCMILLSDVNGFYDLDPRVHPESAQLIDRVPTITAKIEAMASASVSDMSKGGMVTKIQAAKTASSAGCATIIANGTRRSPLRALWQGGKGTLFLPQGDPQSARKQWIAAMKPRGRLIVDQGALRALHHGNSLLPAGVVGVDGEFDRGDSVGVGGPDTSMVYIGLSRYTSGETQRIMGKKSDDIPAILGYPARAALIHRDDMTPLIDATETSKRDGGH